MGLIPDPAVIEEMHRRLAPSLDDYHLVWTHCKIVRDIAFSLAEHLRLDVDFRLLEGGTLLHDIGVYRVRSHGDGAYIRHGILGEKLLMELGCSTTLARFASHHTGVGITKAQIVENQLPLPPRDYIAETLEERLVMYADKFHSKSRPPRFVSFEAYAQEVSGFGSPSVERFLSLEREFGRPNLAPLIATYGHGIC